MNPRAIRRTGSIPALLVAILVAILVGVAAFGSGEPARNAPQDSGATTNSTPENTLLRQMAGTWNVQSRMWTGPDAEPMTQPPAIAKRRLVIGDAFVEEVMTLAPGANGEPFTRVAYVSYNNVNGRYEYFSMDSRAPQMMYQTSYAGSGPDTGPDTGTISLYDDYFVLPQWGEFTNGAFKLRAELEIGKDRQVMRLYFTPLSSKSTGEFLAMEYVYTLPR